ncbi:hypothetical protein JTP67_23130 [Streptomyces sp. S12]|nr:hypothetical protein [Streptomyces sp. S12]
MTHLTMPRHDTGSGENHRVGGAGWTAAWLTGAVALAAEGGLALVVAMLASLREENYYGTDFIAFIGLAVMAVVTALLLALAGMIVSAAVVLPVVQLSRWSARRAGRAETPLWCLAVCGALAVLTAVGAAVVGALTDADPALLAYIPLGVLAGLTSAALCARAATVRRRTAARFVTVALVGAVGAALSVLVFVGGLVAYATGLIQEYEPPRLTETQLVGTWNDDRGGTLTLRADGTTVADDLGGEARCSGSGTWTRGEGTQGGPRLELGGDDCLGRTYEIGGTEERPSLFYWIGDPDSGERYVLHRG